MDKGRKSRKGTSDVFYGFTLSALRSLNGSVWLETDVTFRAPAWFERRPVLDLVVDYDEMTRMSLTEGCSGDVRSGDPETSLTQGWWPCLVVANGS